MFQIVSNKQQTVVRPSYLQLFQFRKTPGEKKNLVCLVRILQFSVSLETV